MMTTEELTIRFFDGPVDLSFHPDRDIALGIALDTAQVGVSKLAAEGASRLDRGSELKGRNSLSAIHERRSPARVDAGIGDEPAQIANAEPEQFASLCSEPYIGRNGQ